MSEVPILLRKSAQTGVQGPSGFSSRRPLVLCAPRWQLAFEANQARVWSNYRHNRPRDRHCENGQQKKLYR